MATCRVWTRKVVGNLVQHFNLQDWIIKIEWSEKQADEGVTAAVISDPEYLNAKIVFYPHFESLYDDGARDTILECLVHEFVHIICSSVKEYLNTMTSEQTHNYLTKENERQTQRLTRIIIKSLPKNIHTF